MSDKIDLYETPPALTGEPGAARAVSIYQLQKLIRDVNQAAHIRKTFSEKPEDVLGRYDLSDPEKAALLRQDYGALYALGVHGLLLRPFSILHAVSEADYLAAIRAAAAQHTKNGIVAGSGPAIER